MGESIVVPTEGIELPQDHPEVLAEKLHERQVHEARAGPPGLRQERDQVGRDECPGGIIDVLPKAAHALDAQEPARPQAQLLRIDVEGVLGQPPVPPEFVSPTADNALGRLQEVDVHHHAFLPEFVPQPPPAAGEPGAGPEVAPPGGGDVDGLRAGGARHDQQDQTKDGRPDARSAMDIDVQTHMVLLVTHVVLLMICSLWLPYSIDPHLSATVHGPAHDSLAYRLSMACRTSAATCEK